LPRKVFVANEILTAADVNTNLMDQAVMVFDDAAARTTAIPSPIEGMVTYLKDTDQLDKWTGSDWVRVNTGFTASTTITASNASWPVPALASPIVKVTVIGGGGGGGAAGAVNASNGGATTFNAGGAGTVTAAGGAGGRGGSQTVNGSAALLGFVSGNEGMGGRNANAQSGASGLGGEVKIAYLNLSGISTVNVAIGAGGAGAVGSGDGSAGGRGEVIVEYVAA
jgi:hypothetical protein